MIIDAHAHVKADTAALLRQRMRALGIRHTVVVAGGTIAPWELARQVASGATSDVAIDNSFVVATSKEDDMLVPFYFATPTRPLTPEQRRHYDACAGLKLAPGVVGFDFDEPGLLEHVEIARERGIPVYSHVLFGPRANLDKYVALARRFPDVVFLLGHAGRHYFDLPAIHAIRAVDNMWLETSGGYELVVTEAVRLLGAERVVFGSEFPIQGQESELCKVRAAARGDAADKVLGGNMARLLRLDGAARPATARVPDFTDDGAAAARRTLARAIAGSAAYRATAERLGVDADTEWSRVPFTTKEDLRAAHPFGMLAVPHAEVAIVHESSGTSGEPTASFLTREDLDDAYDRILRNAIGLRAGDVVLVKTPYAMLSTAHQMHGAARKCGATVLPADNRSALMPYARVVRMLSDYRPTVLYCMPIELMLFARKAIRMGKDPRDGFPWIRACLVNGEMLSDAKRDFLEALWGARVHQDYGSTETNSLAGECSARAMHLWEDHYFVEVLDPTTGETRREGHGELVVTSLRRRAMPLVRYRTGDVVTVERGACACGQTTARVRVGARVRDRIACQGHQLDPIEVESIVYTAAAGMGPLFWALEYDDGSLRVLLEPLAEERDEAVRRGARVARDLARRGLRADVEVVAEGALMRQDHDGGERAMHKPRYVSRRGERPPALSYAEVERL